MCGIAGQITPNEYKVTEATLIKMNSFLKQRGPDSEGYFFGPNYGLAHRRLSIIDLSENGRQPMEDATKNCVITFNGEIYNYKALKLILSESGCTFNTNSDTEVILNGYLAWGIQALLEKLDGMFAFVLIDKNRGLAFACRDRFGKKPLYYFYNSTRFSFSSDIRSIWATESNLNIDYTSIDYFLSELSMPQPHTIWLEIKQIKPAHFIQLSIESWTITEQCYWELNFDSKIELNENEIIDELENLLTNAILKRTVADVPVSTFLSGGIDSGLISSLLALNSSNRIKTYTVGFKHRAYNELPMAKLLARKYNTDHTEIIVDTKALDLLPELVEGFGEPFADSSNIPSFLICKEIAKEFKVALSGDGGDELFGGYDEYATCIQTENYLKQFPRPFVRHLNTSLSKIAYRMKLTNKNLGNLEAYNQQVGGLKLYRQMGFSTKEKTPLYSTGFKDKQNDFTTVYLENAWKEAYGHSMTDNLFKASFKTRLVNDYLVKVDRASMMNSLEVRSPFLDYKLAEFAASIPNTIKLKGGQQKYLLKKLACKYVDKDVFSRKKQGFGIPLEHWLRNELKTFVSNLLNAETFTNRKLFNQTQVQKILQDHMAHKKNNVHKIWALVSLELWFKKFVD